MDLRKSEHRRQTFTDFYQFHLDFKLHPGMVYQWLPALAEHFQLTSEGKAWLTWINGNTQNPVTSYMILQEAPTQRDYRKAIAFWDKYHGELQWDTDRRHQKRIFGEATHAWVEGCGKNAAITWRRAGRQGWGEVWKHAIQQPHMGRLSAWSMSEYAFILGLHDCDADTLLLTDSASTSHRNGLRILAGAHIGTTPWDKDRSTEQEARRLTAFARDILKSTDGGTFLTLESALCTYKSWHKPNRRYPGVYADMAYERLLKAEQTWGKVFEPLWKARREQLPQWLRLEDFPNDPGLCREKQNHYLETGQTVTMGRWKPEYLSDFDAKVDRGEFDGRARK